MSYLDSSTAVFPFDNALQSLDLNPIYMPPDLVVYTVDLTVYITGTGLVTKYYATHGIVYAGNYYEPRLKQPGNFQQSIFANGTTGGASQTGYGEIVLINSDGGLDAFPTYGFDGRPIVLRKIIAGVATLLMSCSAEQPVPTWDTVPIRVKDKQQLFNVPIQPTKYAGTNALPDGTEGTDDIKGKPKPILYGQVSNATPVCVNTSRLIYQAADVTPIDLLSTGDFASSANWTLGAGWSIGSGVLSGTSTTNNVQQDNIITAGKTYVITYTIATRTAGAVLFVLPGGVVGTIRSAAGTYSETVTALYSGYLMIGANSSFTGTIDNISVKEFSSGLYDLPAVYDKGVSLTRGADYGSISDMQTNAPTPGTYRAYLLGGMFRLGSAPAGQITFDGIEGATAADRTAAQITKRLALRGISNGSLRGFTDSEIDLTDITALDTANSSIVGIYINKESTIQAALDEVLGSVGAWYGFDSAGILNMGRLEAPTGTPVVTLTQSEILSIERQATNDEGRGLPLYKVNLGYAKNNTVQDAGSLAGSINPADTADRASIISQYNFTDAIQRSSSTSLLVQQGSIITDGFPIVVTVSFNYLPDTGTKFHVKIDRQDTFDYATTTIYTGQDIAVPASLSQNFSCQIKDDVPIHASRTCTYSVYLISDTVYGAKASQRALSLSGLKKIPGIDILRAVSLAKEYLTISAADTSILIKHPTAKELNINTLLVSVDAAATEADRQLALRKVDRDFLSVKVPSKILPADLLGKVVNITIPRYGYDAGKLFIIMGATYDYELGFTTLQLWG